MLEISHSDISSISTKAPCEAAFIGEHHVRIEISQNSMRAFFRKTTFCGSSHFFILIRILIARMILPLIEKYCIIIMLSFTPIWQQKGGVPVETIFFRFYVLLRQRLLVTIFANGLTHIVNDNKPAVFYIAKNPKSTASGFSICAS